MESISEKFVTKLVARAGKRTARDMMASDSNLIIDDFAGGNIDDAFWSGTTDGETHMAREVLDEIGIEYTIEEDD